MCKSRQPPCDNRIAFYHDLPTEFIMSASATTAYLDIYIGNREEHEREEERHKKTKEMVKKNAVIYGFPDDPEQLSMEQQETLREVDVLLRSISLDISSRC